MNNTVENDFFVFPKVKWLQYTGKVGKCTVCRCRFSQDLTHQKSLKSVNFWQSYWIFLRGLFFMPHPVCVYVCVYRTLVAALPREYAATADPYLGHTVGPITGYGVSISYIVSHFCRLNQLFLHWLRLSARVFVARKKSPYFKRLKITYLRELQFPDNDTALYVQKH